MKRDDYRIVKRMGKVKMEEYLQRIYTRGYMAGVMSMAEEIKKEDAASSDDLSSKR